MIEKRYVTTLQIGQRFLSVATRRRYRWRRLGRIALVSYRRTR